MKRLFLMGMILVAVTGVIGCSKEKAEVENSNSKPQVEEKENTEKVEDKKDETKAELIGFDFEKSPGIKSGRTNHLQRCIETEDGYIFEGWTLGNDGELNIEGVLEKGQTDFLYKTDKNGNKMWIKSFGEINAYTMEDFAIDKDGNIFTAWRTGKATDKDNKCGVLMMKLDKDGNILAKEEIKGNYHDNTKAVEILSDGSYISIVMTNSTDGQFKDNDGNFGYYAFKYDKDGKRVYKKRIENELKSTDETKVVPMKDGGYLVIGNKMAKEKDERGTRRKKVTIMRYDKDSNLKKEVDFNIDTTLTDMHIDEDGINLLYRGRDKEKNYIDKVARYSYDLEKIWDIDLDNLTGARISGGSNGLYVTGGTSLSKLKLENEGEGQGDGLLKISKEDGKVVRGEHLRNLSFRRSDVYVNSNNEILLVGTHLLEDKKMNAGFIKLTEK